MFKIIQIDGGLGRVICAVPAINACARAHEQGRVIVITGWPDVFWHNPFVCRVYPFSNHYLWDDVIRHGDFFCPEPYYSRDYYTQKHHLIESFHFLLNGTAVKEPPAIYLTQDEIRWGAQLVEKIKCDLRVSKLCAYQPYGAGAVGCAISDSTNRSLGTNLAELIPSRSTSIGFINCSHLPINCSNVWAQKFSIRELFAVVYSCDFVAAVDSSVAHIAAAFNKPCVSMLGATFKKNVGYESHSVFQRDGFPKSYCPNRFHGFVDDNAGAMDYTSSMIDAIVETITAWGS